MNEKKKDKKEKSEIREKKVYEEGKLTICKSQGII